MGHPFVVGARIGGFDDPRETAGVNGIERGVGPGLAAVGVAGFVRDPQLTLYGEGGTVVSVNDDWNGTAELRDAFASVGAFTLGADSRDAALVALLGPGSYTVGVGSADNSSGLALIEVYELP